MRSTILRAYQRGTLAFACEMTCRAGSSSAGVHDPVRARSTVTGTILRVCVQVHTCTTARAETRPQDFINQHYDENNSLQFKRVSFVLRPLLSAGLHFRGMSHKCKVLRLLVKSWRNLLAFLVKFAHAHSKRRKWLACGLNGCHKLYKNMKFTGKIRQSRTPRSGGTNQGEFVDVLYLVTSEL